MKTSTEINERVAYYSQSKTRRDGLIMSAIFIGFTLLMTGLFLHANGYLIAFFN